MRKSVAAKVKFVKENRERIRRASSLLNKVDRSDEEKEFISLLISEAREAIGYSIKTWDIDICRTLACSLEVYEQDKERVEKNVQAFTSSDTAPEKNLKEWLLSDKDFEKLVWEGSDLLVRNDVLGDIFQDNGITSPADARGMVRSIRFQYSHEDCPTCGLSSAQHYKEAGPDRWKCRECRNSFSITSGTYLDDTKLEYYHWLRFAYLVGEMKITNTNTIANDLAITQTTAWNMIDLLRAARKETSDKKFLNGNAVLSFEHRYEILDLLLSRRKKVEVKFEAQQPEGVTIVSVKPDVYEMITGEKAPEIGISIVSERPGPERPETLTPALTPALTPEGVQMKQCRRKECKRPYPLPATEFYKGRTSDGLHSYCKQCVNEVGEICRQKKKEAKAVTIGDMAMAVIEKPEKPAEEKPVEKKPTIRKAQPIKAVKFVLKPSLADTPIVNPISDDERRRREEAKKKHSRDNVLEFLKMK